MNYDGLSFGREELISVMESQYEELLDFVSIPAFRQLYMEMMSLNPRNRPAFVKNVVLDRNELSRRGITVPEGILLQTSAFGDRRPTLFAVKKFLPKKFHGAWENVNLTFFNEFKDAEISKDPASAWRPPLPVSLQTAMLRLDIDLEDLPVDYGINSNEFNLPGESQLADTAH